MSPVLFLECHNETPQHGGFGKSLTASVVTLYRDEWARAISEGRTRECIPQSATAPRRVGPRMSRDQARQQRERLRRLYVTFYCGVLGLTYCASMGQPHVGMPWKGVVEGHQPALDKALKDVGDTLSQIRIEPGTQDVCDL